MSPGNDVFYTDDADREADAVSDDRDRQLQLSYDNGYNEGYDNARSEYETANDDYNDGYDGAIQQIKSVATDVINQAEVIGIERRNPDTVFTLLLNEMRLFAKGEIE